MFWKRERPGKDDYAIKKYLVVKEKKLYFNISRNNMKFCTSVSTLTKKSENVLFLCFRTI